VVRAASQPTPQSQCELVVLANADDPYYPLAKEIAAFEGAPVAHSLADALACQPTFLLWVVSPTSLSDAAMIAFGRTMKGQAFVVSSGILTASTLDEARALWQRRTQARAETVFAVNAPNPSAGIFEGRIIAFAGPQTTTQPLTKANFGDALRAADYLTFTGHGSSTYLRLDEETKLSSADVPALAATVVGTGSCQTLRPWRQDSIARGFVDRGAAAYSGFVFSPNEGYLIGEFDGLPFRYTWPGFPIGHAIQAQNRGTLQGFAQFPYQFLLGDPRTALQAEPPYRLVEDQQQGGRRTLKLADVPRGVIPIHIPGGSTYRFVRVAGVTAAEERDPFYNSRLQMVDFHADKYVLLVHEGGDLTLSLRRHAPWYWFPTDIVLDSLDHTLIYIQQTGGDFVALGCAVVPLIWAAWQMLKRRLGWDKIRLALAVGTSALFLQGAYVLLRLDRVTITSKPVVFRPLGLVAAFVSSTCGALIYLRSRSRIGRAFALLAITAASWVPMVFSLGLLATFNVFGFAPEMGTGLWNYALGLLPAGSFVLGLVLFGLVLWYTSGVA
jgi:hypothetical protein